MESANKNVHVFSNNFASLSYDERVVWVVAQCSCPTNKEFSLLVHECEIMYKSLHEQFILAMDLRKMHKIDVYQALQWMAMFFRVMPITKQHLHCTCLCFTHDLQEHVQKFLDLYHPVKPFYTFNDYEQFMKHIRLFQPALKRCEER